MLDESTDDDEAAGEDGDGGPERRATERERTEDAGQESAPDTNECDAAHSSSPEGPSLDRPVDVVVIVMIRH